MKKIEYKAPEMEVVELKMAGTLLQTSSGGANTDNPPTEGPGGDLF